MFVPVNSRGVQSNPGLHHPHHDCTSGLLFAKTRNQRVWGLAITRDGKKLYAANGVSNDVSVIDTATNAVVATVKAGDGPWGIAIVGL
jgi:YVTN family beta-propeller protein